MSMTNHLEQILQWQDPVGAYASKSNIATNTATQLSLSNASNIAWGFLIFETPIRFQQWVDDLCEKPCEALCYVRSINADVSMNIRFSLFANPNPFSVETATLEDGICYR
jgi:hypothetical protein